MVVVATSDQMRDLDRYPACVVDQDCEVVTEQRKEEYKCFQYMCYPWNSDKHRGAFRTCKKRSDCAGLLPRVGGGEEGIGGEDGDEEGGNSGDVVDGECYRHPDRRTVHTGICLNTR